jgi:phosphopantothenoylcysteine decarboxylase / phosphopantothenate---cysteine ligase
MSSTNLIMQHKKILIGITGSIAAYKIADLVRKLREQQAQVKVVMTAAAREFITPLTMQALSGQAVHSELLDATAEAAMGHIELARWAELVLIAPASADFLAKLAHGYADNLLNAICLATTAPIMVAPAMNQAMWHNLATQANCQILQQRKIKFLGPSNGEQACGEQGLGRMLEPELILQALHQHFTPALLIGKKVLITAGGTREDIDAVRFISNRSSGKMGYALAAAAQLMAAEVTLITAPSCLAAPLGVKLVSVYSAADMYKAVFAEIHGQDIFIAAAAVADYKPKQVLTHKIKKHQDYLNLELTKTDDILAAVASMQPKPFTVGFAAETENLEQYATTKLITKNLDLIAANLVGSNLGFDSDYNQLNIYWSDGEQILAYASKRDLANQLMQLIAKRLPSDSC